MNTLCCPFCGVRDLSEFEFRAILPPTGSDAIQQVYDRSESHDRSVEHWQHVGGCRAWLRVERNPSNGEVLDALTLGGRP
jgi:heterotetrameric sarcosine oxidase delta subunit